MSLESMIEAQLTSALEDLKENEKAHLDLIETITKLEVAMDCDHEHIKCLGGFMYASFECKDCGYGWMGD